jgi:hypothetical protein
MARIAAELAGSPATGELNAASFRDRTANGCKVAVRIPEFFDRLDFIKQPKHHEHWRAGYIF